jgi:uncharacterized protein (DUF2252 family)
MTDKRCIPPSDRASVLKIRQTFKMAQSAHAYVRGSTAKFYEWLDEQKQGTLPEGPAIWICGDCHAGNLGPIGGPDGRVEIEIRDLDQTVIGNPAHDIIRLGLSLATAARGSDLSGITTAHILEQVIQGYLAGLEADADTIADAPESVQLIARRSAARTWKHLAEERLEDTKPTIPRGSKFWNLSADEKLDVNALLKKPEMHRLVTAMKSRHEHDHIKLLDAAFWMKGCSSLGLLRIAALVAIGKKQRDFALLDLKQAVAAVAPRYAGHRMPKNNAERVIEGARQLSPLLGARMASGTVAEKSVFVRELLPQDLKVEVNQLSVKEAMRASSFLAAVVGKAHARQMDNKTRNRWQTELRRHRSKSLDAPSWLWLSVVSLIGSHEIAYLEHCRRCVVEESA